MGLHLAQLPHSALSVVVLHRISYFLHIALNQIAFIWCADVVGAACYTYPGPAPDNPVS